MENDKKTQVIASDPIAPPQEDHVKVDDEAHKDVDDDTKSDSSELEYFDLDSDHLTTPIESLDDYGPGGFHPVHLGDTLGPLSDPSRFRVLHKLGRGGYGTVWLCRDTKDGKPKALKILSADASKKAAKECPDLKALQLLTRADSYDTNLSPQAHETAQDLLSKHHVTLPTEHFWLPYQPNGTHLCFITPCLGPNLGSFCAFYGHVTDLVKHVCFQLVQALHFLHQKGLCHGDFRPANILFCLTEEVEKMGDDELVAALGGVQIAKLSRIPPANTTKRDMTAKEWPKGLPRYFVGQANMAKLIEGGWCSSKVAIIDFGVSYPVDKPPVKGTGIPLNYAPPEESITRKIGEGKEEVTIKLGTHSDIWALGVTFAELALGYLPFDKSPDDLLAVVDDMEMVVGPIPEPFRTALRKWYREKSRPWHSALVAVDMVTDPDLGEKVLSPLTFSVKRWKARKTAIKNHCGHEDPLSREMAIGLHQSQTEEMAANIERQWAKDKTRLPAYGDTDADTLVELALGGGQAPKKTVGDVDSFRDLVFSIFKWMPEDRVSTAEIMAHPWFKDRHTPSKDMKREGVVSRLSQGTFGIISFMARFPFKAGNFFFSAFSRVFGIFSNPLWFLWRGRSCNNRSNDLEAQ